LLWLHNFVVIVTNFVVMDTYFIVIVYSLYFWFTGRL